MWSQVRVIWWYTVYHETIESCQQSLAVLDIQDFWSIWWNIVICQVLILPKSDIVLASLPSLSFLFPIYFPISPLPLHLLPRPLFQKQLLSDVVLYLYTFAHLPLAELSFSPIHSPLGSCISRGHYSHTSPWHTGAVRQAVQCQHAINILSYTPGLSWWALPYIHHILYMTVAVSCRDFVVEYDINVTPHRFCLIRKATSYCSSPTWSWNFNVQHVWVSFRVTPISSGMGIKLGEHNVSS